VEEALLQRPTITIRLRLTIAFASIFALCVIITLWSMYALSDVEDKIHFLEVADSYGSEVQEARRYEKNFLLYGTNLEDAIQHLDNAVALLEESEDRVRNVVGADNLTTMWELANAYRSELEQLGEIRLGLVVLHLRAVPGLDQGVDPGLPGPEHVPLYGSGINGGIRLEGLVR